VQEAFLRFAPSNGAAAHPIKEPLFYLYRIVRNLAYDVTRKRATESRYSQDYSRSAFWIVPQEPRTPEDDLFLREDIERIDAILETVPARAREAVKMHGSRATRWKRSPSSSTSRSTRPIGWCARRWSRSPSRWHRPTPDSG